MCEEEHEVEPAVKPYLLDLGVVVAGDDVEGTPDAQPSL